MMAARGSVARQCAGIALLLAVVGFLAAWVGVIPVAASAGHWPITAWFLHFTMRQSVETRALGIHEPGGLDDPAGVLKGARHFATSCVPCHGAPGDPASATNRRMTPHPPELAVRIPAWKPRELFWIVKHGIKFTGMPAWPSQLRDDEVWAMVGFLLRLPGLSPGEYAVLTAPPLEQQERLRDVAAPLRGTVIHCSRCHGIDGGGGGEGAFPRLAHQNRAYLEASLDAFAEGQRHSGIMQSAASDLNETQRSEIAKFYAALPRVPSVALGASPSGSEAGREIARRGVPEKGIPSCIHCHGPSPAPRNPFYPKLSGQYASYLILQLELFKAGKRGGTPFADIMHESVRRMTPEQMKQVAFYYAALD